MAHSLGNFVRQTTTSTGTGDLQLEAPATGMDSFVSKIGNGNTTWATIRDPNTGDKEICKITVQSGTPDYIVRGTIAETSNSNNRVNFGAGVKEVYIAPLVQILLAFDDIQTYADGQMPLRAGGKWISAGGQAMLKSLFGEVSYKSIAVGTTVDVGTLDDLGVLVTGGTPTSISSLGSDTNRLALVKFESGGHTLVNSASLALRTGANRTVAAGDIIVVLSDNLGLWDELAYWPASPEGGHIVPHTFHFPGLVLAPSGTSNKILPHYVHIPTGYGARLRGVRRRIEDGTSVAFQVNVNGSGATGFTGLSATTTETTTTPTAVALADGDRIEVVHSSPSGNPHNLAVSVFVEYFRTNT